MSPNPSFEGIENVKPLCGFDINGSFFVHSGFEIGFIGSRSGIHIIFLGGKPVVCWLGGKPVVCWLGGKRVGCWLGGKLRS